MGRLFWKFFSIFWLAQVVTVLSVGLFFLVSPEAMSNGFPRHPLEPFLGESRHDTVADNSPIHHSQQQNSQGLIPPPYPLAVGIVVSLSFAAWLSWYFSRPIRSLNDAFEALADGKLDTRIGGSMGRRRDELTDLGAAFDQSAAKLQTLVEAQRRLLHDVSHELRSPLARLQACSDLLVQQPQRAGELIQRIERETGRMDALVGELLTLARLNSGAQTVNQDPVDLAEVVQSVCVDALLELEAKGCATQLEIKSSGSVRGDVELLYRAIDNILRNAIRYTAEKTMISLKLTEDLKTSSVVLCIADKGPGLSAMDLTSVFEPFFRSRHADRPLGDGYGLGLAITRSIVLSHGGSVLARNRDGGGLEVEVSLPSAKAIL